MVAKKKAVVKKETGQIVMAERPDYLNEDSKRGQEGVGIDDLTIPRLSIIQDLSPQRKKTDPQYIEGADSGMLYNTVSNVLYDDHVMFVPCFYRKEFVIWKSQNSGGGFCGVFPTEQLARTEFRDKEYDGQVDKKGNPEYEINDTGQQFGMIVHDDGSTEDIVISMSKSKRKVDKQFNTLIKMGGGDRFSRIYKVSAVGDQNSSGQDYYNLGVTHLGFVAKEIFDKGLAMYEAISSGDRDVNRDPEGKKSGVGDNDDEQEF